MKTPEQDVLGEKSERRFFGFWIAVMALYYPVLLIIYLIASAES